MRFFFLSSMAGCPWGGSEHLWSETALRLKKSGHKVMASVHGWPETPLEVMHIRQYGIDVCERRAAHPTRVKRLYAVFRRLFQPVFVLPTNQDCEWQKISEFSPDVVCVSQGGIGDGLEWMERCQKSGVPYASVAQAANEWSWPPDAWAARLAAAYQGARRAFFVSQANLRLFEKQCGTRLLNAKVIRNPFKAPYARPIPWPEKSVELKLACVGRLSADKGQDLVLEVLARPEWKNRRITVSFFGEGPQAEIFRKLAAMLGVEKKVSFKGKIDDIQRVWAEHHMLILPSRLEGLPLAIVEAMLSGRPVITTDVAGNMEAVTDNVTGFVANFPRVGPLADAMGRAWEARDRLAEMGLRAAAEIRRIVPADPVGDFATMLISLAAESADL